MGEVSVRARAVTDRPQAERREPESEQATAEPDHAGLDEQLHEDRALRRAERTPHADLRRAAQELRQQQADRVDLADDQEPERDDGSELRVRGDDLDVVEVVGLVVLLDVDWALVVTRADLLRPVAREEVVIRVELRIAVELDPHLHPLTGCVERLRIVVFGVPAVRVAVVIEREVERRRKRNVELFALPVGPVSYT